MQNSVPLIRTKTSQPFIRPNLVRRPRLQQQIAQGLRAPLTLVIAPAGFGKTTLVASCAAGWGMPVAWLSLDQSDNQSGHFLAYLVSALKNTDHRIGNDAAQFISEIQQAQPEVVLTSLINDLDALAREMVLVLDDYQFISSQAIHTEVGFLLEHCPSTFHLLIATRSDPPLPLARLRARGQLLELRTADLRFTPEEAAQFLNDVMGLRLDAELIAMLEQRTEGWIAGLQMAALSTRDRRDAREFIQGFSGTNRYILDYLLEEILNNQSPEIQRFLLYTSILERLHASLCDALLDPDETLRSGPDSCQKSASILEYLERENLFLVSLDDQRSWFRYHQLFADLLKARLQQSQPDLVPTLHIRAATWLKQNGLIPEALRHLFAANQMLHAADLIERYGPMLWIDSDPSVVQMADNLPYEILLARPKIGIYQAWLLINQGFIEKARPLLNDLQWQLAGADPTPEQQWMLMFIRLTVAFLSPPPSTPGADPLPDSQLLDQIPADELILRDAADILYGMALGRRGEIDHAAEFSLKCIQKEKASHGMQSIPALVTFLSTIYVFQGRLHAAAALCREYLEPIRKQGIRFSTAGNLDVVLGYVLYEWNCLEEAETQLRFGLKSNQPWGNIMTDAFGLLALARVLQAKGDYTGAMDLVEKFETRLQEPSRPIEFREAFRTLRVRVQLASGDLQNASEWADEIQHSEEFHLHPESYQLILARIRLAQGRYADVEDILSKDVPWTAAGNRVARQMEINLLLAASMAGRQHLAEALEIIESCLALTEAEDYIQIYLDVGEPVRKLLSAYLRLPAPQHRLYAQKLLGAFASGSKVDVNHREQAGLVEPLSERELEVLHLMSLGNTNPEIAQQLIVARGTVKAHTASIYRKLDASNRTEAVARARQLGILS